MYAEAGGYGYGFHPSKEVFEDQENNEDEGGSPVSIPLRKFLRQVFKRWALNDDP